MNLSRIPLGTGFLLVTGKEKHLVNAEKYTFIEGFAEATVLNELITVSAVSNVLRKGEAKIRTWSSGMPATSSSCLLQNDCS